MPSTACESLASTQAQGELRGWGNGHGVDRFTCPNHPHDVVVAIEDVQEVRYVLCHSSFSIMASCENGDPIISRTTMTIPAVFEGAHAGMMCGGARAVAPAA